MVRPAAYSFPHRGSPSTSHSRVCWQPYYHVSLQSLPLRTLSPLAYPTTQASSTSSIPLSPPALSESNRPRHAHYPPHLSSNKDRAVKSLCDIWPQQDIPLVFDIGPPNRHVRSPLLYYNDQFKSCRLQYVSTLSDLANYTPHFSGQPIADPQF
ncbi:hypothetical protein JVU11DRAFT_9609 [Chiua virens]|nr:hypothetical protein JVU11DRAFT_9609 [Chiua virens]